ncbi:MAG TPA: glycosyltransferase family 4 protein [Pedobacter sp.]|nr:glycosyltransferase family 4 protein [Pedobacter sp.]
MKQKILYVCTIPALEAYSIGLISAAFQSEQLEVYACIFLAAGEKRNEHQLLNAFGVPSDQQDRILFLRLPKSKIVRTLSGGKLLTQVSAYARSRQIGTVHFISQDVMLYGHLQLFQGFKVWYTVHDLVPHEAKLSHFQRAKHYYFRIRKDQGLMAQIPNLVTNSHHQAQALKSRYPDKHIRYHQMPGLITPEIEAGTVVPAELEGISNYVLFFGRIELYKGIDKIYALFSTDPELRSVKLVIAGRGDIYFARDQDKEQNILFLHRFIPDAEISMLFSKARMFVMPYQSATQSAVSSLAYHYRLPVIASNIDGLKDTVLHEQTGLLYQPDDLKALKKQILRLIGDNQFYQQLQDNIAGQPFYKTAQLVAELEEIYSL